MKVIRTLLIVDDNPGDIDLCVFTFEPTGRFEEIVAAQKCTDALDRLKRGEAADLVLLDINMPGMNGFEFLDEYKAWLDTLPANSHRPPVVVMMTSSRDPRDRSRADSYDIVHGFVTKPPTEENAHWLADQFGVA